MIARVHDLRTGGHTVDRSEQRTEQPQRLRGGGVRLGVTTAVVVAVLSVVAPSLIRADHVADVVWWPAAGAALALAVRRPARRWWCVAGTLVGAVAANELPGGVGDGSTVIASAQALQCGVGAAVVSVLGRGESASSRTGLRLRRGRDAWRLTAGALAGVAAAALLLQTSGYGSTVAYALSQLLGILLVAPLMLMPRPPRAGTGDHRARAAISEWVLVLILSAVVSAAVLHRGAVGPWSFLVVLPILWGAARLGVGRALSCQLVVAVIATAGAGADPAGGQGPVALQALLFTSGAVALVMSLVVRSRERAVVTASRREEVFRRTFDDALLGVALLRLRPDGSAVVARVNDRLQSMLGVEVEVGSDWSEQVHPDQRGTFVAAVAEMADEVVAGRNAHWHAELQHGDGEVWLELAAAAWPTPGENGPGEVGAVVQVADVTQRRLVQRRLREAALHDPLTGLPNRTLLEDRLRHALSAAHRSGNHVALLYCDLDDFKPVNDTGGHAAGDHVLIGVAERLAAAVRPGDTVARLGGDEFAVVCPDLPDEAAAAAVAERVVAAMTDPFPVAGWEFKVGISVGLAMADLDQDAARVLQQADAAMYEAKGSGKGRVRSAGPAPRTIDLRHAGA
ncbi:diguanylate cyclase domain-containing protein [Kineococcus sp. GCM10028916]|uniref:diguanylate cyclase domain-containing protein n=1 Tax=Kineococcus sp. GCM10028916 TaxID=3273394 RepID=UPI003631768A